MPANDGGIQPRSAHYLSLDHRQPCLLQEGSCTAASFWQWCPIPHRPGTRNLFSSTDDLNHQAGNLRDCRGLYITTLKGACCRLNSAKPDVGSNRFNHPSMILGTNHVSGSPLHTSHCRRAPQYHFHQRALTMAVEGCLRCRTVFCDSLKKTAATPQPGYLHRNPSDLVDGVLGRCWWCLKIFQSVKIALNSENMTTEELLTAYPDFRTTAAPDSGMFQVECFATPMDTINKSAPLGHTTTLVLCSTIPK